MFPLVVKDCGVRRRDKQVLGPVDLTLDEGGPTMIVGPNGSGKTTLLRVMHGIERISDGAVQWHDDDPKRRAFVFQSPIVLRRSVTENLMFPLLLSGVGKVFALEDARRWLDRIGLHDWADGAANRLSGGERQKLAIARALITDPAVLFLDEPTANLDGQSTREIEALLQESAAAGTRLIMATHDMGQARRLAAEVVFMLSGKVHESGPSPRVFDRPVTPELAAFLKGDIVG
ncbi:ABC transporter ATP-binding protein [Yoonia sp. 2307UL14-13]|uniref:ABC transporter ATP-binding protein n=1 Tax=Yoonia sp. 2307UL14-13 TaxID=3126506 RepID=UPI0030B2CEFC